MHHWRCVSSAGLIIFSVLLTTSTHAFSPNNFPGLKKTLITVRSNPLPVDAYSLIPVDMNSNFQIIISSIDPTKYWFMFPVAIGVATCAITAGIGGAALFGPIFLIIFPLLGPQYAFESPATSVGIAILIETFGFSSGVLGYLRRGLIDFKAALKFSSISAPVAFVSSFYLSLPPLALKAVYTCLMVSVSIYMLVASLDRFVETEEEAISADDESRKTNNPNNSLVQLVDRSGNIYRYSSLEVDSKSAIVTSVGAALSGVLGVGIGECILPQFIEKKIPIPVAAATSVVIVTLTCAVSAGVQISALVEAGGITAIPWSLVIYTIPGVIIGAQLAAALQGRIKQQTLQRAIGVLFGAIGVTFTWLIAKQSGFLA